MNKRGFTLVELIAIIAILTLISLIVFPNLINSIKDNKQKEYDQIAKDLCLAGETYINSNMNIFSSAIEPGNEINITVSELINYGSVNSSLKNPKTNESVENDKLIFKVLDDKSLECEYKEG